METPSGVVDVPMNEFSSLGARSVVTYTPRTAHDYGSLLCWAVNEAGTQRQPCRWVGRWDKWVDRWDRCVGRWDRWDRWVG